MKIIFHKKGKTRKFYLPFWLLTIVSCLCRSDILKDIPAEDLRKIVRGLKAAKRGRKRWEILSVEDATGEGFSIIL